MLLAGLLVFVFLLFLPGRAAAAGTASWSAHDDGISGSSIVGLAIDPTASTMLYALTSASGIYKTTDGQVNWTSVTNLHRDH
jgi:hypothetical protein